MHLLLMVVDYQERKLFVYKHSDMEDLRAKAKEAKESGLI